MAGPARGPECSFRYMQPEIEYRRLVPLDYDQVIALWRGCDGLELAEGNDRESFTRYVERHPGLNYAATRVGAIMGASSVYLNPLGPFWGHRLRAGRVTPLAVARETLLPRNDGRSSMPR